MKTLKCSDMGAKCGYEASGETAEEVKGKMMEHAKKAHREMMNGMSLAEIAEMDEKMDGMLK